MHLESVSDQMTRFQLRRGKIQSNASWLALAKMVNPWFVIFENTPMDYGCNNTFFLPPWLGVRRVVAVPATATIASCRCRIAHIDPKHHAPIKLPHPFNNVEKTVSTRDPTIP